MIVTEDNIEVLLIEDGSGDGHVGQMLARISEPATFAVHQAADLEKARQWLSGQAFDVIVLYLAGIGGDSFNPVGKLRNDYADVAIVVVAESGDENSGIEAIRHGADDYLIRGKIFQDVLGRTIHYAVERKKEQRRTEEKLEEYRDHLEELVSERTSELIEANQQLASEIAERRQAEEKIRRMNEQLEQRVAERTCELTDANKKLKTEISERKNMGDVLDNLNKQLAETVQKLTQSNRSLREFAHIIAHDLKSPLRAIGTLADWIYDDYHDKLDEHGREKTRLLSVRARRMSDIIDSILKYTEIRTAVSRQQVNLDKLVHDVAANITIGEGISIDIASGLPTLACEKVHIAQVFENLLMNAVKFMNRADGKIEISCTEDEDCWKFCVADNGPGISDKYFDRIFEVFQTLSPRDEIESTGIGLAVVKKIIEMYGGRVWVESIPGRGSRFFFTLPKSNFSGAEDSINSMVLTK